MMVIGILVITTLALLYYNFTISLKANHCDDNLNLINDDLGRLTKVLRSSGVSFRDFNAVPDSIKSFHISEDPNVANFQLLTVGFDEKGNIVSISH